MNTPKDLISRLNHNGWLKVNFYRAHVLYFLLTIILSSVIMYGSGIDGHSNDEEARFKLRYIDALFLCTSAMTNTGLNTVNMSSITAFQQSILFILILLGNITLVSTATVWIRRHFFRRYMQDFLDHSKAGRQIVNEIDRQETGNGKARVNPQPRSSDVRRRHPEQKPRQLDNSPEKRSSHHETGHGGFPYPWEWKISRYVGSRFGALGDPVQKHQHHYLSFEPSLDRRGRFHSLNQYEREELGGVEYRSLGVLVWLLPAYIVFWLALATIIMVPWSYKRDVEFILDGPQPGRLKPGWWASFLVVSGFGNCGLDLLDMNMIPFQGYYLALIVIGAAKLAGNTFFPVFLRLTIWTISKLVKETSRLHHSLAFLLHHPRRCFILLFPSVNTWYLAAVQAGLHLLLWAFWFILQIDYPQIWSIPTGPRIASGLFQALGVRTAGMYIVPMSDVAPALLVLYTGAMYISGLPIIISIRSTNIYEERSIGVQKPESQDDTSNSSETSYIGTHLQKQLASDAWWLFIAFFLICIVERTALAIPSPGFDVYAIFFDTVSAFGTVGLSTGVPYDSYSFCGAWHTVSKLVLIVVMIRGRHRGLPMAIDRAVLLPGQELMKRMDREYNNHPTKKHLKEEEAKIRRDESGAQAESSEEAQDPEQTKDTRAKMHQSAEEEAIAQTA